MKKDSEWLQTDPELDNDYIDIRGLDPDEQYEFKVVAVDGGFLTESESQFVSTYGIGKLNFKPRIDRQDTKISFLGNFVEEPLKVPSDNVATAGWFIGMMLAIAFLILILIIICIIKRNRGGKYDVHDRELANGRHDYPDEGGFHEYSQP
jgi:neuronal cell adhesion protein